RCFGNFRANLITCTGTESESGGDDKSQAPGRKAERNVRHRVLCRFEGAKAKEDCRHWGRRAIRKSTGAFTVTDGDWLATQRACANRCDQPVRRSPTIANRDARLAHVARSDASPRRWFCQRWIQPRGRKDYSAAARTPV